MEETAAFITTIEADHTIVLPSSMPVGATIAVVVVSKPAVDEEARRERFATTLNAIRAASQHPIPHQMPTDLELDALIERARKAPRA